MLAGVYRNARRLSSYQDLFTASITNPEAFWAERAQSLHWDKPFTTVLDRSKAPLYQWFPDGRINMCYNCLDRHVLAGRGEQHAFIYDSPLTKRIMHFTYSEVLQRVQQVAGVLLYKYHIKPGDKVVIYMPLVPEALIAMLACARIGATHSVVFGGFAAKELASRLVDVKPKLIFTANMGIEPKQQIPYIPIVDAACQYAEEQGLAGATSIPRIVTDRGGPSYEKNPHRDIEFYECLAKYPLFDSVVSVHSHHPLYVLYTSGTTGMPKGIVRDTGGYATALYHSLQWVFGAEPGEVFWAASDIGWVVGHTLMVYGPLLRGCTTVIYEGKPIGTPDASAWWRLISQHQVQNVFVAPTGVRAIKKEDPEGDLMKQFDLSSVRHIGIAGERCDPDTIHWLQRNLPSTTLINDQWWQTESGWPMISNYSGIEEFPVKPGSATKPVPGWDMKIIGDDNSELGPNQEGKVCVKLPTPPGFMLTLLGNNTAFVQKYMSDVPGHYLAGDEGFYDEEGYFNIMGRLDDVINTAGHRLSTGQMEEIIGYHPDIAECAVVGVADAIKGEIPVAFVVAKSGHSIVSTDVEEQVVAKVREELGAVASLKTCICVARLPKTRSGKILRNLLRSITNGAEHSIPATIEDASVIQEIEDSVRNYGFIKH